MRETIFNAEMHQALVELAPYGLTQADLIFWNEKTNPHIAIDGTLDSFGLTEAYFDRPQQEGIFFSFDHLVTLRKLIIECHLPVNEAVDAIVGLRMGEVKLLGQLYNLGLRKEHIQQCDNVPYRFPRSHSDLIAILMTDRNRPLRAAQAIAVANQLDSEKAGYLSKLYPHGVSAAEILTVSVRFGNDHCKLVEMLITDEKRPLQPAQAIAVANQLNSYKAEYLSKLYQYGLNAAEILSVGSHFENIHCILIMRLITDKHDPKSCQDAFNLAKDLPGSDAQILALLYRFGVRTQQIDDWRERVRQVCPGNSQLQLIENFINFQNKKLDDAFEQVKLMDSHEVNLLNAEFRSLSIATAKLSARFFRSGDARTTDAEVQCNLIGGSLK